MRIRAIALSKYNFNYLYRLFLPVRKALANPVCKPPFLIVLEDGNQEVFMFFLLSIMRRIESVVCPPYNRLGTPPNNSDSRAFVLNMGRIRHPAHDYGLILSSPINSNSNNSLLHNHFRAQANMHRTHPPDIPRIPGYRKIY